LDAVPYVHATSSKAKPLLAGERVGLLVPDTITASGITIATVEKVPAAVGFRLDLQLLRDQSLFVVRELTLTAVPADELKHVSDLLTAGVSETVDIDASVWQAVRLHAVRRAVVEEVHMPVLVGRRETSLYDEELTGDELTALCWLRARLTFGDVNVLIAEQFGCTRQAAGTRLKRARQAGVVPPVEVQGQRKARP
jgi:hypothetical protein